MLYKMNLVQVSTFVLLVKAATGRSFTSDLTVDATTVNQIANITYGKRHVNQGSVSSIFTPRMDFEQWKPLTGRGDPLRNDPTYDYEPPVLDRVHYWAEETRLERHYPERKSEVLMLGVSSRKPSAASRQPALLPLPPRRHIHRPLPNKYEDFTYKLSDHYPMTILVPPPPPPRSHQSSLYVLSEDKHTNANKIQTQLISSTNNPSKTAIIDPTTVSEDLSSFYALQESNLIFQSSTTQNWVTNETKLPADIAVSSDYAGWGPTTPMDDSDAANETHNLISGDHIEFSNPYSFYKPLLSEATPPTNEIFNPLTTPTILSTTSTPTTLLESTTVYNQETWPTERTTEVVDIVMNDPQENITESKNIVVFQQTPIPTSTAKSQKNILDMLGPMMSMPMINDPERPEDNLYAHASENVQVFNEPNTKDIEIETMQTMQPPPPLKHSDSSIVTHKQFHVNSQQSNKNPALYTHGPYLYERFTTPIATTIDDLSQNSKSETEINAIPTYLIIQGHSKVKTYGSKPKEPEKKDAASNKNSKPLETNEVKHLHPLTKKTAKKLDLNYVHRRDEAKDLKTLIEKGLGSIEIQETDVGIQYDVSDGSNVPIEIYRKGIVDNDENHYFTGKIKTNKTRTKRQIDLEDLLPFDEDDIEEYVYNYLEGKKNESSITGLIAQAVTSDAASAVDELENEDEILEEER